MPSPVKPCTMCQVEPQTGYNTFCRGCNAAYMRKRRKEGRSPGKAKPPRTDKQRIAQRLLTSSRDNASVKGQEHTIGLEDIVVPDVCPVYGVALKCNVGGRKDDSYSIDRINTSKGYVPGNVIVMSWRANRRKADLTAEEMRAFLAVMSS